MACSMLYICIPYGSQGAAYTTDSYISIYIYITNRYTHSVLNSATGHFVDVNQQHVNVL